MVQIHWGGQGMYGATGRHKGFKTLKALVRIQLHAHEFSLKVERRAYTSRTEGQYLQLVPVFSLRVEH